MIVPASSCVWALNALQNSMMFTPCCPSAGPTGGAGLAAAAGICSFIIVRTFFAIGGEDTHKQCRGLTAAAPRPALVGADVRGVAENPALVGWGRAPAGVVDRLRALDEGDCLRRPAVVPQLAEARVGPDEVGRRREARAVGQVGEQVVSAG